jgi:two-component system, NarL family, invasion response regulator UvrY
VLIVDDHPIVRRGLVEILKEEPDIATCGEASDAAGLLEQLSTADWSVVVLDISLPDRSGLDVLLELKEKRPDLPVLILSMLPEDQFAIRALQTGAAGYISKQDAPDELVRAIRRVLSGRKYVSDAMNEKMLNNVGTTAGLQPLHARLSNREFQVMCLLASGKTVKEIADELYLSAKTIGTYRARILGKMNMQNNTELIRYVVENHLIG